MKTSIALALATMFLASCATPAEQAAKFEKKYERSVQTYGSACENIGFERDTDPWRHCVMTASPYPHTSHH